jgi:hypothetical protein
MSKRPRENNVEEHKYEYVCVAQDHVHHFVRCIICSAIYRSDLKRKFRCHHCSKPEGDKKFEKIVYEELRNEFANINIVAQYRDENCKKKNSLPIDYVLFSEISPSASPIILIEVNEASHFREGKYKSEETDAIKFEFAVKNQIPFLHCNFTSQSVVRLDSNRARIQLGLIKDIHYALLLLSNDLKRDIVILNICSHPAFKYGLSTETRELMFDYTSIISDTVKDLKLTPNGLEITPTTHASQQVQLTALLDVIYQNNNTFENN